MSPLVSSAPEIESKPKPKLDPALWDAVKQIEEFKRKIFSGELVYTQIATQAYYVSKLHGFPVERGFFGRAKGPKTLLADEISQALMDYQQYKDLEYDVEELFRKAQKALYWIYNAHAVKAVEPGPAVHKTIQELKDENAKLKNQIDELTKKLGEKEFIIKHLGGTQLGDVMRP
jgi:hypothetical protein